MFPCQLIPDSLFLVPASMAPLRTVSLGEDNLLLSYTDERARLWDIKTREFWRSMSVEKADDMIKQGGWTQWYEFGYFHFRLLIDLLAG